MSQVQPQQVITKDKMVLNVDAVVFFKVKLEEQWVKTSEYNVNNFEAQIEMLARTTLRNRIGTMEMSEANMDRERSASSSKTNYRNNPRIGVLRLCVRNSRIYSHRLTYMSR